MKAKTISLIAILLVACQLSARDYSYPALEVTIWLETDGSMRVEEKRTFSFEGSYSEGFRTFPTNGMARFTEIEVSEDGTPFLHGISREPGSMLIVEKQDMKELQWFYKATDTTRTFTIRFKVDGAIQRYEDVAVIYYQVISPDWNKPIENIQVRIIPPAVLSHEHIRQWWHGSLHIVSETLSNGNIVASLPRLSSKSYMEIRALYPQDLFIGLPPLHGMAAPDIIAEEAAWAEEANIQREKDIQRNLNKEKRHETGRSLAIPLGAMLIMGWVWIFMKFGRRPAIDPEYQKNAVSPSNEKPALINYLIHYETITLDAMLATLFDMANKNILTITEKERKKTFMSVSSKQDTWLEVDRDVWEKEQTDLKIYELSLLKFLFDDMAAGQNKLNLTVMQRKRTKTQRFFMKWKQMVRQEGRGKAWFDENSRKGRNIGIAASIVAFIAGILLVVVFGPWMLIVAGVALIGIIASLAILHRTMEGEQAYRQWKQVRNMLKSVHIKGLKKDTSIKTLAQYVIYGVALGLGKYQMQRFLKRLDKDGYHGYLPWIVFHTSSTRSYGDTIGKVITTAATTMSSATGAGGGGSMGGGGGAASGRGGAR